jgi:thioredoxin 1
MKHLDTFLRVWVIVAVLIAPVQELIGQTKRSADPPPKPLVTFIELGSVRCIPCRMMQPVMKSIEEKYGDQVKIVFYDVWTQEGQPYASHYGIRLIPTQVFLDKNGKEFFRHEGFFPEAEIDKLLQKHGLKIRTGG